MCEKTDLDLFNSEGEALNINQLCELINYFEKEQPMVYQGKGAFQRLFVHKRTGASKDEIKTLVSHFKTLNIPADLISFLRFSNGIGFFEYSDACFLSVDEIIELSEDAYDGFIKFANYNEDSFCLKCDGSERNVYVSEEDIEEPRPLNMSFVAFVDACLISGFSYFWLWGKKNDLY